MEDVSAVVGHVAVNVGGKDYILDNAGWDDWSVFKNSFVEEKRTRIIRSVLRLKGTIPADEYGEMRREAIREAGDVLDLGEDDIRRIMNSREGMGFMLWVMLERRYPQAVTRPQCEDAVKEGKVTEDQLISITNSMFRAMGLIEDTPPQGTAKGNAEGRGGTAA